MPKGSLKEICRKIRPGLDPCSNVSYLYVVDVVPVPSRAKELVAKSEDENVLHHLLSKVVVDTEDLVFSPVGCERPLELSRTSEIFAERFLDLLHHD